MRHLTVFLIELGKRLDVVAGKGDGNDQDVLLPPGTQAADHLLGAGSEPTDRSDVRLLGQDIGVRSAQLLDYPLDTRSHLLRVGVSAVNHVQR